MRKHLTAILDEIASEALASGDQAILSLVEEAAELVDGGNTGDFGDISEDQAPETIAAQVEAATETHLIERMENLIACLDELSSHMQDDDNELHHNSLDNAYGIAGEILTMIDGR